MKTFFSTPRIKLIRTDIGKRHYCMIVWNDIVCMDHIIALTEEDLEGLHKATGQILIEVANHDKSETSG